MTTDIDAHLKQIRWGSQAEDGEVLLSPSWEVFVLGISILSVFNLLFLLLIRNPDLNQLVVIMDSILTIVFLVDLARRMVVAKDNRAYLVRGHGWIDVLSVFPILRIFRLLRILRVLRVMNRLGGPAYAVRAFFSNKAAGGLLTVILIAVFVVEWGSLLMLAAERGMPDSNIENAEDAIWYMFVTMSTVGYGDVFPVTTSGRVIGAVVILVGVGVFGTLTGFIANVFLSPANATSAAVPPTVLDSADSEAGSRIRNLPPARLLGPRRGADRRPRRLLGRLRCEKEYGEKKRRRDPMILLGCLIALGAAVAPRVVLILAWIFSDRWVRVWQGEFLLPLLGIIFLPYTTIMYMLTVVVLPGGGTTVEGFGWVWIILGVILDIMKWGQVITNRRAGQEYATTYYPEGAPGASTMKSMSSTGSASASTAAPAPASPPASSPGDSSDSDGSSGSGGSGSS